MKSALIILEYIMIPLGTILASFLLKQKLKKHELTVEEFLEDLNIDIKIICSLCLFLFGISCGLHNDSNNTWITGFAWSCISTALLGYILIHYLPVLQPDQKPVSYTTRLFGIKNSLYKDSSWFIIILTAYVLSGIMSKHIINTALQGWWNFTLFLIYIIPLFLIPMAFFFILNKWCKSFFLKTSAYNNTYNRAFPIEKEGHESPDTAIKGLHAAIASMHKHDPLIIGILQRLAQLYERKEDIVAAENYWLEVIKVLEDEKVNQSEDYIRDAFCELLDFYERTKQNSKREELLKYLKGRFPNDLRFRN